MYEPGKVVTFNILHTLSAACRCTGLMWSSRVARQGPARSRSRSLLPYPASRRTTNPPVSGGFAHVDDHQPSAPAPAITIPCLRPRPRSLQRRVANPKPKCEARLVFSCFARSHRRNQDGKASPNSGCRSRPRPMNALDRRWSNYLQLPVYRSCVWVCSYGRSMLDVFIATALRP